MLVLHLIICTPNFYSQLPLQKCILLKENQTVLRKFLPLRIEDLIIFAPSGNGGSRRLFSFLALVFKLVTKSSLLAAAFLKGEREGENNGIIPLLQLTSCSLLARVELW